MKAICGVRPPSLRTGRKDLAELHVDVAIGHGVGRVEDQRIDARIGQHLGMAADDPGVVAAVVAKQRLAPIVRKAIGSPQRRVGLFQGVGIGGKDLADVIGALAGAALPPASCQRK